MGLVSAALAVLGSTPRGDGETLDQNALSALLNEFNGNIDAANIKDNVLTPAKRTGGFAIGDFASHTTTGSKSITGVGFKPKLVRFHVFVNGDLFNTTGQINEGHGVATGSGSQRANYFSFDPNAPVNLTRRWSSTDCIWVADRAGAGEYKANLTSLDGDGFTINVSFAISGYRVIWEAYG